MTVYKSIELINDFISKLDEKVDLYIHIDQRSSISIDQIIHNDNIYVFKKIKTRWGGINHFKAYLFLASEALLIKEYDYFHLLTGQDCLVNSFDKYDYYFSNNMSYLEYEKMPVECWDDENGGFDRIKYYRFYDMINSKNKFGSYLLFAIFKFQKMLRLSRIIYKIDYYGGSGYCSLTLEALRYVLDYLKHNPEFVKSMKYTFCAEEIIIQSILLNSSLKNKIVNNNLRYIDWTYPSVPHPKILDENDYDNIVKSRCLFARKVDYNISAKLLRKIYANIK